MQQIQVHSTRTQELVDITQQVADAARNLHCSAILVFIPHTTAGVLINEHADPDVARDIVAALDRLVPDDGIYRHAEGNSPAHLKASLVGTSQLVPFRDGTLQLGTWQGVFLAEFDGPRTRTVYVIPAGEDEAGH
jgi:secondary thiamine-phosphate synthase enzyme